MPSKIYSATTFGLDSQLIEVEADLIGEAAKFIVVGLPDVAVQEARERVRSAIKNSDFAFPRQKITVNLAPADLKKTGPIFDLPIAVAILITKRVLELPLSEQRSVFIGELALNGKLRPINGALAIAMMAKKLNLENLYLPADNAPEASLIQGLKIFPVDSLARLVQHLKGKKLIKPCPASQFPDHPAVHQSKIFPPIQ